MKHTPFLWLAAVAVIFIFAAALSVPSQTVNMGRTYISSQNVRYPNEGVTGTTVNKLAKLTGAPSTTIIAATTDTEGIIGIVVAGAGAAGSADIAFSGKALCDFDSATTAGHYVTIDTSTAGDCMDTGAATYPTSGQVIGIVTSTNGGAGTYEVDLTIGQPQAGGAGGVANLTGTAATRPTCNAGSNGQSYYTTDSPYTGICDGSAWAHWVGSLFTTPIVSGDFSWTNQGTCTVTQTANNAAIYECPTNGGANSLRVVTKAVAGNYSVVLKFRSEFLTNVYAGLIWRQSSDGKLISFSLTSQYSAGADQYGYRVLKWTNPTTFSASYANAKLWESGVPYSALRIRDDGASRYCDVSTNGGLTWMNIHSVGRTDFLTADQIGLFLDPASSQLQVSVLGWEQ